MPFTVPAGGTHNFAAFSLHYTQRAQQAIQGTVRLHTNLSAFDIPLNIFTGKLYVILC
jgi:hypothetical protein